MKNETAESAATKPADGELADRFGAHLERLGGALQGLAAFWGLPDENS